MKKSKGIITTIAIFSLIFSSSQVLAAKPLEKHNKTENVIKSKEKNDNNQSKKNNKQKNNLKHIETLNKRLNDIENSLTNINKEIDKYFNVQTQPSTSENQNTSSEANNSTTDTAVNLDEKSSTSGETQLNEESNSTNEGGQTAESAQTVESGQTVENGQTLESGQAVENDQATEGGQALEEDQATEGNETIEDEKLDEEFNGEYKEEDNRRYNSFYGKLNSLLNKLDTVKKQVEKGSNNSDEVATINERYSKLVNDVTASINRVKELQQNQVSEIRGEYTNKKLEEKKINEAKKDWEIKLTKGIKDDENNFKNISILDSKGNVLDTTIKYDVLNKKITISTGDGFIKGESYTILIGGDLESSSGEKLGKNVEKNFTVE